MVELVAVVGLWGMSRDVARDVQTLLVNESVANPHFDERLKAVVQKCGLSMVTEDSSRRSVGDPRAKIYWLEWINPDGISTYQSLFVWPSKSGLRAQILQSVTIDFGKDFVWGDMYWKQDRLTICGRGFGMAHFRPGWLLTYRQINGRWRTQQSLPQDSYGQPEFMEKHGILDPNRIIVPVYTYKPYVYVDDWYPNTNYFEYAFRHGRYVYLGHHRPSSPISTVEDLISAGWEGNPSLFGKLVSPRARRLARAAFGKFHHTYVRSSDRLPFWSMPTPTLEISSDYRLWFRKVDSHYILTKMLPGSPYYKNRDRR